MNTSRFFPGWIVVGGAFLAMFVAFGSMYAFAAFFTELEREFSATRADVSLIFSIAGFLYFTLGAVSGSLADRIGTRLVVAAGTILLVAGLVLASRAQTLLGVYVFYGLGMGLGVGFMYVPSLGAIQRWFNLRRGFASGLAVSGIGVGTLVMPPLAAFLVERGDWRSAYLVIAAIVLVLGLLAALLLEHSPSLRGFSQDGLQPAGPVAADSAQAGIGLAQALRSQPFWLMYLAGAMTSLGMFIPFVHLTPYVMDLGLSEGFGVLLIGLLGMGSVAGRFVLGGVADRIGRRPGLALMFLGMAAMMLFWLVAAGPVLLVIFAVFFGVFYGGFVALVPALAADYFGGRSVSGIIGFLYSGAGLGVLFGPPLAGLAFDLTSSYVLPILVGAAANLLALACILKSAEPARFQAAALAGVVHESG
jgi:MFS family permease